MLSFCLCSFVFICNLEALHFFVQLITLVAFVTFYSSSKKGIMSVLIPIHVVGEFLCKQNAADDTDVKYVNSVSKICI